METLTKKQKLQQSANTINKAVDSYIEDPQKLFEFFMFSQQFHDYSYRNRMLIHKQRPHARQVAKFSLWKEKGYQVRKGEHALSILAPTFKKVVTDKNEKFICYLDTAPDDVKEKINQGIYNIRQRRNWYIAVPVFDIAQTTCPVEEYPAIWKDNFVFGKNEHFKELSQTITDYLKEKLGVVASPTTDEQRADILKGARGITIYEPNKTSVYYDSSLSENQQIKTLIHETAHASLHTPHFDEDAVSEDVERGLQEFQAELCAGVVCTYYGIDTSAAATSYIHGWLETVDPSVVAKQKFALVEEVLKCADTLTNFVDKTLYENYGIVVHKDVVQEVLQETKAPIQTSIDAHCATFEVIPALAPTPMPSKTTPQQDLTL